MTQVWIMWANLVCDYLLGDQFFLPSFICYNVRPPDRQSRLLLRFIFDIQAHDGPNIAVGPKNIIISKAL
jgi:hypothetical protein